MHASVIKFDAHAFTGTDRRVRQRIQVLRQRPVKHRPVYRWRDTLKEPITFAEFLADTEIPAVRMLREEWDQEEKTWRRSARQNGETCKWRVGLFGVDGKLIRLYGHAFDSESTESRDYLVECIKEWGKHEFKNGYLGLIPTNLTVLRFE